MDDGDGGSSGLALALFLAGPGSGVLLWMWIKARYRNKGARYKPESVVSHQVHNLKTEDEFMKDIVTKDSRVKGRNESDHHKRAAYSKAMKS